MYRKHFLQIVTMVNIRHFAKRLEKIMAHYEISATILAEKIDFNRSSISHLISGRNKPSLEFVMKILENFDEVSWEWLVLGKGSFPALSPSEKISGEKPEAKKAEEIQKTTSPDLFTELDVSDHLKTKESEIDEIVIFYKNGTFKNYKPV